MTSREIQKNMGKSIEMEEPFQLVNNFTMLEKP